ncbi:MAG: hypothetical protein ACI8ZN_002614 [Bacteroidia bacterium]
MNTGEKKNVLNLGGTAEFSFTDYGPPPHINLAPKFVRIQVLDPSSGVLVDITTLGGLTLEYDNFEWVDKTVDGVTFPVMSMREGLIGPNYSVNPNKFTFGDVASAKLTTYSLISNPEVLKTLDINLINTLEEAFDVKPSNDQTCYRYNPFNIDISTILYDV